MKLLFILFIFSFMAEAQEMSEQCNEAELKKQPNGESRLLAARTLHGSGIVDPKVNPGPTEHGISRADLKKEIVYFDPIKNNCSFSTLEATPFGKWAIKEMQWRELQKLIPRDISYHPVEIDAAYTAGYWRTLTLTSQASLFDRRAALGMRALIDSGTACSPTGSASNAQLFKDYAEKFTEFYKANLADYIPESK